MANWTGITTGFDPLALAFLRRVVKNRNRSDEATLRQRRHPGKDVITDRGPGVNSHENRRNYPPLPGHVWQSGVRGCRKALNINFILADDLGYGDLGCYGQAKIRTPISTASPRRGCGSELLRRLHGLCAKPLYLDDGTTSGFIGAYWDILSTLREVAGVPAPAGIDGVSIVPSLLGRPGQTDHEYLYWEYHGDGRAPGRAVWHLEGGPQRREQGRRNTRAVRPGQRPW